MRRLLLCLFILSSVSAIAQDISNFTQFFINPYTLNPSYAGVEGRLALFAGYRKQWTSIEGAPTISNFSLHAPISNSLNFGLSVTSDKRGIAQVSAGMATIGYNAIIDKETSVRFGLSAGYGFNNVNYANANVGDPNDPVLTNLMAKNSFLIGNAGLSFHKKTFHAGVALPNIFQPVYLSKGFAVTALKPFQSVVVHASNRFYVNGKDQTVFEPYLIYRLNSGLPSQLEAAAVVHLQNTMWLGASYKQQFGISGLIGFKIQNQFAVGFSYSIKNGGANQIPAPSYEVQLGMIMGNKKKDVNAYSFVDTHIEKKHKKTNAEILADRKKQQQILEKKIADDRKKHEEQIAKQKAADEAKNQAKNVVPPKDPVVKNNVPPKDETKNVVTPPKDQVVKNNPPKDEVKNVVTPPKDPVVKNNPPKEEVKNVVPPKDEPKEEEKSFVNALPKKDTARGGPRMKAHTDLIAEQQKSTDPVHLEEQEKIKRLEEHADNPTEEHNNEVVHPHAERHEIYKRGSHQEELDYGDYVIVGVFKGRPNAEHFSNGLNKMAFTSDFGFLTEKAIWYVYIAQTNDINEAKAERDKYRKLRIFRDAWLLTIQK
jgi:type IX secretion system PorP/SprF family membrane protein